MTTSVTYTFSNATTADATQVNQNFTDVLAGLNGVDKLTTRGDLLTRNATVYSRLAVGAAGKRIITDGTDPTWGWTPVIVAKSADYVVTDTDGVESIWMTTAGTNRTVTLPTAADNTNRRLIITKVDSGVGTCIIDGEGSETVGGSATITLLTQYESLTVHCNGTSWSILGTGYNKNVSQILTTSGSAAFYAVDDATLAATTFQGNLGGAASAAIAIKLTRIGRLVKIDIPEMLAVTPASSSTAIVSNTAIPAAFRPALTTSFLFHPYRSGAFGADTNGELEISSAGAINFYSVVSHGAWPSAPSQGWKGLSVSYTI